MRLFFGSGCRWRICRFLRNCYRGWYRITFPSEARIPSQPLAKKTVWIDRQLSRNYESTSISSSLKHLTQKRITKGTLCILLWITLRRRFRQNNCLNFRYTVNRNFFFLILTQVFLEPRQDNPFTLWPTSFEKLQPFPHLIFPLLKLSTPNCPWIEKCKERNNVLKENLKQMTMDCPRPLLRLKTTPMWLPVPLVSLQDTLQTPRQRWPRALSRLRWCRSSTHAQSSNDTHQLDWAIGPNWTSEVWICLELSQDHLSIALQVNKDLGKIPHWNLIGVNIIHLWNLRSFKATINGKYTWDLKPTLVWRLFIWLGLELHGCKTTSPEEVCPLLGCFYTLACCNAPLAGTH